MNSASFYSGLTTLTDFGEAGNLGSYAPLPDDWHVVTCDVRNSTAAVEAGRYKNVNTVGAAVITAMLNAAGDIDIPFIFEGDGAMLCVPPRLLDDARAALLQARHMAGKSFGLDLRVATLPVSLIRSAGFDILVARYRVSEHYVQAVFAGGGMAYADRYMKDPATAPLCAVDADSTVPRADFDGLECRWQDIPSRHGETVSIMVRALSADANDVARVYRDVIACVRDIYGGDESCHPVWPPNLAVSLAGMRLDNETGVRMADAGPLGKGIYRMKTRWVVILGWLLMRFGIRTRKTDWGGYKQVLARNSDVRKVNDCFRQILAGNAAQREQLGAWLEQRYRRRELAYGMHVTDRAQMTCLVFDYSGRHLHFIDGADGGLFMAAKDYKERLARLA